MRYFTLWMSIAKQTVTLRGGAGETENGPEMKIASVVAVSVLWQIFVTDSNVLEEA